MSDIKGKSLSFGGINTRDLAPQVENLTLKGGDGKIDATFSAVDAAYASLVKYYVVTANTHMPNGPKDGVSVMVMPGTGTLSCVLSGLENGVIHHVRVFIRCTYGWQTSPMAYGVATPLAGILAGDMSVGTLIVDPESKYYDAPIVWKIADIDHHSLDAGYPADAVTLITDKIITLKCFDAIEPSNPNSDRKNYGNNRYSQSNVDRWLNSSAGAGAWWDATHSYDAAPTIANVWDGYNEYDAQAGFLYTFSANMRNALLSTFIVVAKNTVTDGGGSETISRKVFLTSITEVGYANENGIAEGSKLAIFSDNVSRRAYPTAEAVANSEYTNSSLSASQYWWWWLRTPYASNARYARYVDSNGTLHNSSAYDGIRGVCPLCNISKNTLLSPNQNADGTYNIVSFA